MPLDKSCSLDAFQKNVRSEYHAGKTAKGTQHVAIAISTLKRACGVADDDRKMTPKEIVASSSKGESKSYVRLMALIERKPETVGPEWFGQVAEAAGSAAREAEAGRRGPASDRLLGLVGALAQKTGPVPTFEWLHRGADGWGPWRGWVNRMMFAAENLAVPELALLVRAYGRGEVRAPARGMMERIGFQRGIDFANRSSAHGAPTSPSSAPPEANSGANAGTFRAYADNGEIKSGDGRAPKKRKR